MRIEVLMAALYAMNEPEVDTKAALDGYRQAFREDPAMLNPDVAA
jgi:hypothetical protein